MLIRLGTHTARIANFLLSDTVEEGSADCPIT